jgi:hypothetical protein
MLGEEKKAPGSGGVFAVHILLTVRGECECIAFAVSYGKLLVAQPWVQFL